MRILFIQNSMDSGGISKVNKILAERFNYIGHEVEFLSYKKANSEKYKITSFNFERFYIKELFITIFKLVFFLRVNKYDLIISSSDLESLPVCIVNVFFKNKLLVNSHTNIVEHLKSASFAEKWLYKICGFSYRFATVIGNVSKGAVLSSKEFFNIPDIIELPNPITEWKDSNLNKKSEVHEWFVKYKVIVACGRFIPSKNYDLMLKSFSKLLIKNSDVRLIILGDGLLFQQIQTLVIDMELASFVSILGNVPEPRYYMSHSEFLLHTSSYEGAPMVLLEALSVGIPVVSTNFNSGAHEILEENKYGLISKSFSPDDIYLAMEEMLKSEKKSKDFYKARAQDFSPKVCADKYLEAFCY